MRKYIEHTLYALAIQFALFLVLHNYLVGFIAAVFFFTGREIAQAEYRYIRMYTNGKRKSDMRWWKTILTPQIWSFSSLVWDLFLPAFVTALVLIFSS